MRGLPPAQYWRHRWRRWSSLGSSHSARGCRPSRWGRRVPLSIRGGHLRGTATPTVALKIEGGSDIAKTSATGKRHHVYQWNQHIWKTSSLRWRPPLHPQSQILISEHLEKRNKTARIYSSVKYVRVWDAHYCGLTRSSDERRVGRVEDYDGPLLLGKLNKFLQLHSSSHRTLKTLRKTKIIKVKKYNQMQ